MKVTLYILYEKWWPCKVDGEVISGEGTEVFEKALRIIFPNVEYSSHQSYMAKGYSMVAKEKRTILAIKFAKDAVITEEEIDNNFKRADLIS